MRMLIAFSLLLAWAPAQANLNIFACEPEWAALSQELGGDKLTVFSATTALQDPHRIQARPSLIAKMRKADLAVCTGAELEIGWLPVLLTRANNPAIQAGKPGLFEASQFVDMQDVPVSLDRSQGDVHPFGNPHIQGNPHHFIRIAQALSERLIQLDAANRDYYQQRHSQFEQRWLAAIQDWQSRAAPLKGVPVVSDHQGWSYLYQWLGMIEVATLEPKPGIPPSAGYLQSLLDDLQNKPARLILQAAYTDDRPAKWLNERSKLTVVTLPFTVGEAVGANDLFALFEVTIERLLQGLHHAG